MSDNKKEIPNVDIEDVKVNLGDAPIPNQENSESSINSLMRDLTSRDSKESPKEDIKLNKMLKQSLNGLLFDCSLVNLNKLLASPKEAFKLLPKNVNLYNIKGMSLVRQPLVSLEEFILTLNIINISYCGIKTLQGLNECKNLKYLNADYNQIESLAPLFGLENLIELHIAHNQLKNLKDIIRLKALILLDISGYLWIKQVEDLRLLSQNKSLKNLILKDTGLREKCTNAEIKRVCPNIVNVSRTNSFILSYFKNISEFITVDEDCASKIQISREQRAQNHNEIGNSNASMKKPLYRNKYNDNYYKRFPPTNKKYETYDSVAEGVNGEIERKMIRTYKAPIPQILTNESISDQK